MARQTLANFLGEPTSISPLWIKAKKLGLSSCAQLESLAIERGCSHYAAQDTPDSPQKAEEISDEELAILLLSPANLYSQRGVRIAAQLLSAERIDPAKLLRLARLERAEHVLRYIAECGSQTEPESEVWRYYLNHLDTRPFTRKRLPHISRFRSETGITNPARPGTPKIRWLRA